MKDLIDNKNVIDLVNLRESICYALIEAVGAEKVHLELQLDKIEQALENVVNDES